MNAIKKVSLKTRIIGMVFMVILLLSGGGLYTMSKMAASYKLTLQESKGNLAQAMGDRITAQFFERYGDVQAFAMNPILQSKDRARISVELDAYVKLYGIYDLIIVTDKEGRFVASNSADVAGSKINTEALDQVDYSQSAWFQAVVSGKTTDDTEKGFTGTYFEPFIKDPYAKQAFGEVRLGSGFSAAIKNDKGELVGVISNRAGSRWIEREFVDFYAALKAAKMTQSGITLVDGEGRSLVHHQPSENDGKNEIVHDFDGTLFKNALVEPGSELLGLIKEHKNSVVHAVDSATQEVDVIGLYFINGDKWISTIDWSILVHEDEVAALSSVRQAQALFYIIFGCSAVFSVFVAIWFGISLGRQFQAITQTLEASSSELLGASNRIASSATELSESATEQAAALQETVAAVDEISAMVEKNAEAANRSKDTSTESRATAEKGKQIIDSMLRSIDEIDHANNEISMQMDQSNRELSEITKLMSDISNKTKVINEIVFQTKLLSFNASVEAARAGEYGKGFAVVAEEVGNLAQMSGNAAKDITTMLEDSVRKVDTIVSETKTRVERLMSMSKEKVKVGSDTAKQANEALEEIITNVATVDTLVTEIAVASNEQSTGIREISKAVGQMEQVTQQNSTVAQQSSVSAAQLNSQATALNAVVGDLASVVTGSHQEVGNSARTEGHSNNVVAFRGKKTMVPLAKSDIDLKAVSGSDIVPSSDDPGFKD